MLFKLIFFTFHFKMYKYGILLFYFFLNSLLNWSTFCCMCGYFAQCVCVYVHIFCVRVEHRFVAFIV